MNSHDQSNDLPVLGTLQSICGGIAVDRAEELLEASNGSLERAIDIFFHQQQQNKLDDDDDNDDQQPKPIDVDGDGDGDGDGDAETPRKPPATPNRTTNVQTPSSSKKKRSPVSKSNKTLSPSPPSGRRKQARLDFFFGATTKTTAASLSSSLKSDKKYSAPNNNNNNHDDDDEHESFAGMISTKEDSSTPSKDVEIIVEIDEERPDASTKDANEQALSPSKPSQHQVVESNGQSPPRKTQDPSWKSNELSFRHLAATLQRLTDTTKRLVKLDVLKEFVSHIVQHPCLESQSKTLTYGLLLVLGFRSGTAAPMDVGGAALSKALQTILGASRMQLSKGYRQFGDMGDAAASLFQKKSFFITSAANKGLTIVQVYESFEKIVATDGRDAKQRILLQLLRSCNSKVEIRFLVRLLIGNMRVGANLKTVLAALAMTFVPDDCDAEEIKRAVALVQKTHDVCPNLLAIITALLKGGLEQVPKDCRIQLLTPIAPMLAHPIHSLEQVAKAMKAEDGEKNGIQNRMTMEWKYDGVRCQAHYDGTCIKLFSRHMLETTEQYPDAAKGILNAAKQKGEAVESFILDAEIVGVEEHGDEGELRLLPFQDLSRRKKKSDDGQGVQVKVFAFDLMYLNGVSYIDKSLEERQAALQENFVETNEFAYVSSEPLLTFDECRIRAFLEQAVEKGAEGLMLKMLGEASSAKSNIENNESPKATSPYEAGTRSHSWLKVKRDYVAGYADTIDVVPIGAWYGHGRKAQKSFLSPVLFAVYDDEEDLYRSISRCMSFTDAMYEAMREFYFRGTPYPTNVGIEETDVNINQGTEVKQELDTLEKEEESESDGEEGEGQESSTISYCDEDSSLVNCFASRPSSAYVVTNESPPIWFKPMEVFEVSFADMSLSRQHTAGAGLVDDPDGRGVALRFPRFKRRRPDKKPSQCTTSFEIAQLFAQQSKQGSSDRRNEKPQ